MKQLQLDLGLPPESAITPAISFTAGLKRELVTQMAAALITVYQAGGPMTDEHALSASQNYPPAPATQSDRLSASVLGATGTASHRKPTLAV
jgi:hypothetical protein